MTTKKVLKSMDGNEAAAYCAYAFSEVAAIYPITPSSPIGEHIDAWASKGKLNLFNMPVKVVEMQSEAGAAGAVHGSLQMGVLTSTYTASQGLLLMIPNMYKIAGQGLPGVIHVAARSIAAQALSIFGDHQDVMATRQTGFAMLSTDSVQQVMDLAGVAHLASISTSVPFLHFFDGFRVSHEVNTIEVMDYKVFDKLLDRKKLEKFRKLGLSPNRPVTRGSAQSDDVYFQAKMATAQKYEGVDDVVNHYMEEISKETGRNYAPFVYYGDPKAENVIIAMGSINETIKSVVDNLNKAGHKVGALSVHLYRPFSEKYFFKALPKTVKKIAVLDRTHEAGAYNQPLHLDVEAMFYAKENRPQIIGGIYGLSSKDTTPQDIEAVFINLDGKMKNHFTIGITDDVSNTSLVRTDSHYEVEGQREVLLFGLGSDGTVGASKNIVKIIGDNTKLYSQAYASYDSKKAGGITRMHLRFGKNVIDAPYLVSHPHFVSCSTDAYLKKYDMIKGLRRNGTFLLNTSVAPKEIETLLPNSVKRQLAEKEANLYIVDAQGLAYEIGLGRRINTIMQSAFFKLNEELIEFNKAKELMKEYAKKSYAKKGEEILNLNYKAIEVGGDKLVKIKVKPEWKNLTDEQKVINRNIPDFVKNLANIVNKIEGDSLPVSAFMPYADGHMISGTAQYEKRGIANFVPAWNEETCIQCNQCVFACPHAVIRSFLLTEEEVKKAPKNIKLANLKGKNPNNYKFSIQVSALDCTECGVCVEVCPTKPNKSLKMTSINEEIDKGGQENANYCFDNVEYKDQGITNFKDINFRKPLFEFSGACAGCGETPYIKAVTQLFGDRMVVANATGCTSIYGGSFPATPYTTDKEGHGPAWANSLFEDNAEFGFGMKIAHETMRDRIQNIIITNLEKMPVDLKEILNNWVLNRHDGNYTREHNNEIFKILEKHNKLDFVKELIELKDYFVKVSQWIFGGDGWAYDIGYGGIDHVIANMENVNILVVDTEVYSNTGGQSSKAAPYGAIAKFAASGKKTAKKDLAAIAMAYGSVYVAQISHGANPTQMMKALKEAEEYDGPSIIIAYSPCIEHGIKGGLTNSALQAKLATECGYWPIFRYDPRRELEGKNPFQLDGPKKPNWERYEEHLLTENRYSQLKVLNPKHAEAILKENLANAKKRYKMYKRYEAMDYSEEE